MTTDDECYEIGKYDSIKNNEIYADKIKSEQLIKTFGKLAENLINKRLKYFQCNPFLQKSRGFYFNEIKENITFFNPHGKDDSEILDDEEKQEKLNSNLTSDFNPFTLNEILNYNDEDSSEWIIDGIIQPKKIGIIAGSTGTLISNNRQYNR